MLRVISGLAGGSKLFAPPGLHTRPTADRTKESFFNMIGPTMHSVRFLDLFAGSGGMGIEALSRGAESCVFVDDDPVAMKTVVRNLEKTKLVHLAYVIRSDFRKALRLLGEKGQQFDVIFMDPPYSKGLVFLTLRELSQLDLLAPGGFIAAEMHASEKLEETYGFVSFRVKEYSTSKIIFLGSE